MVFKSRTVVVLIIVAMTLGVLLTQAVDSIDGFWKPNNQLVQRDDMSDYEQVVTQLWNESGLTLEQLNKIASTYYLINENFYMDADPEVVISGAINGMLSVLDDPYTVYMDEEQAKLFAETVIDSTFSGIGAEVTLEDGKVTVVAPIKGSPAEKAGLHAQDQIVSVNGERLEGLSLNEAVMKIRGPKGTQAKLEVLRPGALDTVDIIVVRDDIDVETVFSEMLGGDDARQGDAHRDDAHHGDAHRGDAHQGDAQIGLISISKFSQNTAVRFHEALEELEKDGLEALIIDVRNNPGGILHVVVELLEPLIPKGETIVQVEDRNGDRAVTTSRDGRGKDYPIVVLTNKGSASASEILAAALQESAGQTVIGEATFGKGTVQSPFEMAIQDGSNIKMTISKWLTPDGHFVNEVGVQPNIVVDMPDYFRTVPFREDVRLKHDMLGAEVLNLQRILAGLGYDIDRKDGYFSLKTKQAVKDFQMAQGLPVNGEVDYDTAIKLEEAIIKEMRKLENDTQLTRAIQYLQNALAR